MELKHFSLSEFTCSHTGKCEMNEEFLKRLDELRERCGFPFTINSGYRHKTHPIEAKKIKAGTHSEGIAVDIRAHNGTQKHLIVKHAMAMGFRGVGIADTFIHVDDRQGALTLWAY